MKKQIFGILFTFFYLVAMLKPLLPLIVYYANYDYIVTELCENRDKPYLECNGNCYLEALKKRVEPIQNNKPVSTIPLNMNDYPISTLDFYSYKLPTLEYKDLSKNPDFRKHFLIHEFIPSIFKPPRVIS